MKKEKIGKKKNEEEKKLKIKVGHNFTDLNPTMIQNQGLASDCRQWSF